MQTRTTSRKRRKPRAATNEVLGAIPLPAKVPSRWRKQYSSLIQLRNKLLRLQADLTKDALDEQPSFSTHMADAGTDAFDRDFALGLLSSEQDALREIDQALKRIHNGTYGICELTGKKIRAERLEAIPWTRFSEAAERELEKAGGCEACPTRAAKHCCESGSGHRSRGRGIIPRRAANIRHEMFRISGALAAGSVRE